MTEIHMLAVPLLSLFILLFSLVDASPGDRSQAFQDCLYFCERDNCTVDSNGTSHYGRTQPVYLKALLWDCGDECKYFCMWYTLDRYAKDSYWVPQFYGKWPFVRVFGFQEPASVAFSLLNLYGHAKMMRKFKTEVPKAASFYHFWHIYFLICVNGWVCSTIFHARDTPVTEKLDYLGAFAMVLFTFYSLIIRIVGFTRRWVVTITSILFAGFYLHHNFSMFFISFDYKYNLNVNILVGGLQIAGWLTWCAVNRKRQYVWRCGATMILVCITTIFEVVDFPPVLKTFDAHAFWHLSTAALPYLWYRFLIDDTLYLHSTKASHRKLP